MTAEEFLAKLEHVRRAGPSKWTAQCPAHDDQRNSLSIRVTADRLLLHCFVACTPDEITGAVGCTVRDLFLSENGHHKSESAPRRIVATYDYTDGAGHLIYQVVRYEPKSFAQRRPDAFGGWIWSLGDVRRVLYRLPHLVEQRRVYWCEGEKDCDNLAALGVATTTAAGGAGAFRPEYAQQLVQLDVLELVSLPDNDPAGRQYAETVAAAAQAAGLEVRIVALPGLVPKGDVSDWLAAGGTREELEALVGKTPAYQQSSPTEADSSDYIESIAAFLAEEDPPLAVVFPELLPAGVIMLLHGEPRARKSLAAWELALAAATGTAPFGLERFTPAAPIPVLYIQEEDPRSLTRPRLRRLVQERCGAACPARLHVSIRRGVDLDDPAWVTRLIGDLQRLGIQLLVLDAARRFSAKTDEGPSKVREFTGALRALITATGVTIVIVHHDIKPARDGQDQRRRSQRASGGDWFAACECPVHVERVTERESLVYPQDYKFSGDPAPFTFTCEVDGLLVARLVGADTTSDHAERAGLRGKVLEWLRTNGPASKTAMKKAGLGRWETIEAAIDGLLRENRIDAGPGRKAGTHVYFIASAGTVPHVGEGSTGGRFDEP